MPQGKAVENCYWDVAFSLCIEAYASVWGAIEVHASEVWAPEVYEVDISV